MSITGKSPPFFLQKYEQQKANKLDIFDAWVVWQPPVGLSEGNETSADITNYPDLLGMSINDRKFPKKLNDLCFYWN